MESRKIMYTPLTFDNLVGLLLDLNEEVEALKRKASKDDYRIVELENKVTMLELEGGNG